MKLRKGDTVVMLSGKDRGKTGTIQRINPKTNRVIVQGLNLIKRHLRPRQGGQKGQIVSVERWVAAASVAFLVKETGKPTRLGWQVSQDGSKIRIDRKRKIPV